MLTNFKKRNGLWRWACGLVVLSALLLVACGGAATPQEAAPAGPTPTVADVIPQEPKIEPTEAPVAEVTKAAPPAAATNGRDTVRIATNEEPLAVGFSTNGCLGNIQSIACEDMIHEPFTWIDNKSFQVVPLSHIEDWEQIEPDRWRFKLREGVTFHNGVPWDAEQAKFWIDWSGDEETAGHGGANSYGFHGPFSGEVVDPMTVDFVCPAACPILPRSLIFTKVAEVGWWEQSSEGERAGNSVGLGPYKLVEWRRGTEIELEVFEDYMPNESFASQAATIPHVIQLWRNEPQVRAAMLDTGEADWAEITLEDRHDVPKFKVGTNNEAYIYTIDTVHHPELRKEKVRQALNLATDCQTLMRELFDDLYECFGNIAQMGTEGITEENSAPYPYDPERARQLLEEANYDPENVIKLHIRSQRIPKDVEYGESVVTFWKEVGINAELQVVESSVHTRVGRSNCGHQRTQTDFREAAGESLWEKCRNLGPGPPNYQSMHLTAPATSTESLDLASRQGRLRLSCYGRSSGVCNDELQEMIADCNATPFGPERVECNTAIGDYVHDHYLFHPNFINTVVYGMAADLEWEPYYSPRIRANTMNFSQ